MGIPFLFVSCYTFFANTADKFKFIYLKSVFIFNKNCHILFFVSTQNLIIYKFNGLYQILEELGLDLNFKIIDADDAESLNEKIKKIHNYLILSNKKYSDIHSQFVLDYTP